MSEGKHLVTRTTSRGCVGPVVAGIVVIAVITILSGSFTLSSAIHRERVRQEQIRTELERQRAEEKAIRAREWTEFTSDALDGLRTFGTILLWFSGGVCIIIFVWNSIKLTHARVTLDNQRRYWMTSNNRMIDTHTSETYDLETGEVYANETTLPKLMIHGQVERIKALGYTNQRWNASMGKTAIQAWQPKGIPTPELAEPNVPPLLDVAYEVLPTTVSDFLDLSELTGILAGTMRDGPGLLELDLTATSHFIIVGQTNQGKSWLTLLLLAQLNRAGVHLTVYDGRKNLADYRPMIKAGTIEGYTLDETNLEAMARSIVAFAEARQAQLEAVDSKDLDEYAYRTGQTMQRYCFLIEEAGALARRMQGSKESKAAFVSAMNALADAICWVRQVGIHIMLVSQVLDPEFFPKDVRMNANTISFLLPGSGYRSLDCSPIVGKLGKGEFIMTTVERDQNNNDIVFVTPWSEQDERHLVNKFQIQSGESHHAMIASRGGEEADFSTLSAPSTAPKVSYPPDNGLSEANNPSHNSDSTPVTGVNPPITDDNALNNPPETPSTNLAERTPEELYQAFEWDEVDWLRLSRMTAKDRQSMLKLHFPKLTGPPEEAWEIEYLCRAYNQLEGHKSDICFMLWGSKGGRGDNNRWEWLQDAIDDYLVIDDEEGEGDNEEVDGDEI